MAGLSAIHVFAALPRLRRGCPRRQVTRKLGCERGHDGGVDLPRYASGLSEPSMVGKYSDTVGWMCIARCKVV